MALNFTRWFRKQTGDPVAHIHVRFSIDRQDLLAAAVFEIYEDHPLITKATIERTIREGYESYGRGWAQHVDDWVNNDFGPDVDELWVRAESIVDVLFPEVAG